MDKIVLVGVSGYICIASGMIEQAFTGHKQFNQVLVITNTNLTKVNLTINPYMEPGIA